MNALIIEDDELSSKVLTQSLTQLGVKSIVSPSTEDAEEVLKFYQPQVIFLDLTLPGRGGLDFLIERQRDASLRCIPVVVISGKADHDTIHDTVVYGVDDYLIKPVQLNLLKSSLIRFQIITA